MTMPRTLVVLGAVLSCAVALPAAAEDQVRDRDQIQYQDPSGAPIPDRTRIRGYTDDAYGAQMMSEQERREYSAKMSSLKTEAEREQLRVEHRARMQERAEKMGVVLPGEPDPQMHEEAIRLRPQPQSMPEMPGMGGGGGGRGR